MTKKFNNFAKVCALVPIVTKLWPLLFEGVPCNSHSRQYLFRARWHRVFSCSPIPCWTVPCQVQWYNRVDMVWEQFCVRNQDTPCPLVTIQRAGCKIDFLKNECFSSSHHSVWELILPVARAHPCASRTCDKLFVLCAALLHRQKVGYDVTH